MKDDDVIWKGVASIVGVIVGTVLSAWVLTQMWGWFIVPLGVASIGMAHAWGLIILIHWLTDHNAKTEEMTFGAAMVRILIAPLFVLLFGSVAFWLM